MSVYDLYVVNGYMSCVIEVSVYDLCVVNGYM